MKKVTLTCIAVLIVFLVKGQEVSRPDAIRTVMTRIIVPQTLDHPATAFMTRLPLQMGDTVTSFAGDEVFQIEKPTWFAWINDHPNAFFTHPTRYVFIDVQSGHVTIEQVDWWPELNGESLFMSQEERKDLELIIYSDLNRSSIEE